MNTIKNEKDFITACYYGATDEQLAEIDFEINFNQFIDKLSLGLCDHSIPDCVTLFELSIIGNNFNITKYIIKKCNMKTICFYYPWGRWCTDCCVVYAIDKNDIIKKDGNSFYKHNGKLMDAAEISFFEVDDNSIEILRENKQFEILNHIKKN